MQAGRRAGARGGTPGAPAVGTGTSRGTALRVRAATAGSRADPDAGAPNEKSPKGGKLAKTSTTPIRAMATKGQSPTRKVPKGGPGTATARVQAGLPEEYSKNIIPQGSFWRDGRKPGKREPFKKKWSWLSNGIRRACGDTSMQKGKGTGNWLKAPKAPPPPTDPIGNRKTPTAKQRRAVRVEDMGWYGYLALKPVLPKVKGEEEMDMWTTLARDGRRGAGRNQVKENPSPKAKTKKAGSHTEGQGKDEQKSEVI